MVNKDMTTKLFDRNFVKWGGFDMNLFVSIVSAILVLSFTAFTLLQPEVAADTFSSANSSLNSNFNWLFVFTVNASFIFLIVIGLSKLGRIRLGGFSAKPEYSNFSWYAMLFSAGIGIGIFFYGVAEPIYHLTIPEALQSGRPLTISKSCIYTGGEHMHGHFMALLL